MKKKLVFSRMLLALCVYVFLHLLAGPGAQLQAATLNNYCKTYLSGGGFDLSAVSITGSSLNFTGSGSYGTTSDGSYYYEVSPTAGNTCTLEPGKTYTLSVTTTSGDIVSVWFDFNQNGTFEATEWTQVSTSTTAGTPSSCSFTVPATAITGQTGMRIRSRGYGNTNGANDACSSFGSGCTLDFTLTIGSLRPAVPTADFSSMSTFSTPGSFVQFYDQSLGVPANWKWTFTGGSPSTSSVQNPVVSYAANGTYNVKLVVSNALGADSIVKSGYITISNAITMPVTGSRNISTCNALIYDNGGTANYSSYSDGTTTIYPGSTGSAVKLDFISFNVNTYDYLYVFNGTSTSATLLGTFTGSTLPNSITATNPSGALTLRFYSNNYNSATAGFVAQASCADLVLQNLNAVNWTSNIDNNKNGYSQSKMMNCSLKNESTSSAVVYTKLYAKLSTDATYTLLNTSPSITIPAATSYTQSYQVNGLNTKGTYSFKIEMYNGANTLLNSFDSLKVAALGGLKFESSSDDAIADYVVTGLAGNGFDLTSVSITGTTLNNTAARPTTSTNGNYYVEWQPTTGKTCTLTTSSLYTLNITSQNSNMSISAWIDYNHDKVFQASEWIQVATQSAYGTASTVTFRVPANALAGNTRMRIRTNSYYYSNTASDAASSFSYGSTEDYTINILQETPTKPVVNFMASDVNVSVGTTVQFADLTTGVPTAWSWRFNGATPATSTLQNPSVLYSAVGTYPVTLIATNSLGTDSITKTAYINVSNTVNMPASGSKSITACGLTIYDNGGTSNYSNSTNGILTIYPASANSALHGWNIRLLKRGAVFRRYLMHWKYGV